MKPKAAIVLALLALLLVLGGCKLLNKEKQAASEANDSSLISQRPCA